MALWVGPDSTPHPDGTQCSVSRNVPDAVVIVFEGEAKNVNAGRDAIDPTMTFVAYTDDFRQSVRKSQSGRTIRGRATLCVRPTDRIALTMWGWQDSDGRSRREKPGFSPEKPVLSGQTHVIPASRRSVQRHWQTDDLTFRYRMFPLQGSSPHLCGAVR
jgi:hypothetical protein